MSNNPLEQYFRRPSVYIKLPSGGLGYPEGVIDLPENGEIPVYPMSAIDEITSRTPDALFNGTAVVELIRSCVPCIKDPWQISNIDLDPILVAIRTATFGNDMEINSVCPSCKEDAKYGINLASVLAGFKPGDYNEILNLDPVQIKFKPLTYREINEAGLNQFQVQKALQMVAAIENEDERNAKSVEVIKEINEIYVNLLSSSIEYIKIPNAIVFEKQFIIEYLRKCDKRSYEAIKDFSIKLRESTENKPLKIKCIHCTHEYEQPFSINVTDFFD